jgi:dihydroorotase
MKINIKQAKIKDIQSDYHNQLVDVFIEDGVITSIGKEVNREADITLEIPNLHLSKGWFDLKAHFCDPGEEHKESIETGLQAAEAGGFTHVGVLPSTKPTVSHKAQVEYLIRKSAFSAVQIHPMGTLTEGMQGENLAELYDMYQSGARFFMDDTEFVSSGILYRALLYVQNFGGRLMSFANDKHLSKGGMVNEGMASTWTGLKPIPSVAEIIQIERDLRLVEYTGGSLHFTGISTAEGVELIRKAKQKGFAVTADVHFGHLMFTEQDVLGFDSNFKVLPPYRREADRQALWAGLQDGTLDAIVSDHRPHDKEEKDLEFDLANFGMIGFQFVFGALGTVPEFDLDLVIEKLSNGPRMIYGINDVSGIQVGQQADFTLCIPDIEWSINQSDILSKSFNTPLIGQPLKGKPFAILNKGQLVRLHETATHE